MNKIFDSRDPEYKSPFGAAACGAAVRFAVRPGTENVTGVSLLLRREFGGTEQALPLSPSGDAAGKSSIPPQRSRTWYGMRFNSFIQTVFVHTVPTVLMTPPAGS